MIIFHLTCKLEDTARYAGFLVAPAEGFGFGRGKKKAYYAVLANFWCSVVTLVTFSSKLDNFKQNPKIQKIIKKSQKI